MTKNEIFNEKKVKKLRKVPDIYRRGTFPIFGMFFTIRNLWTVPFREVYVLVLHLADSNDIQKFPTKNIEKCWRNPNGNN
jgi:hypothetical protein